MHEKARWLPSGRWPSDQFDATFLHDKELQS